MHPELIARETGICTLAASAKAQYQTSEASLTEVDAYYRTFSEQVTEEAPPIVSHSAPHSEGTLEAGLLSGTAIA